MKSSELLSDDEFTEVTDLRTDNKKRITLGKIISEPISGYRVYRNLQGQLLLDPLVTLPAREAWLYDNPERIGAVKRGIQDAAQGKLVKRPSYAHLVAEESSEEL